MYMNVNEKYWKHQQAERLVILDVTYKTLTCMPRFTLTTVALKFANKILKRFLMEASTML